MTQKRQRLRPEARKTQLLEQGIEWFATHHGATQSMAAFAKHYGLSTGLLYHYFESSEVFFLNCQTTIIDQWTTALTEHEIAAPMQRLTVGLTRYIEASEAQRAHFECFLMHPPYPGAVQNLYQWDTHITHWLIEQLGYPNTPPVEMAARCWLGSLRTACLHRLQLTERPSAQATATYLQHMLTTNLSLAPSMLLFDGAS